MIHDISVIAVKKERGGQVGVKRPDLSERNRLRKGSRMKTIQLVCAICEKTFTARPMGDIPRYCSNRCYLKSPRIKALRIHHTRSAAGRASQLRYRMKQRTKLCKLYGPQQCIFNDRFCKGRVELAHKESDKKPKGGHNRQIEALVYPERFVGWMCHRHNLMQCNASFDDLEEILQSMLYVIRSRRQ